MIPLFEIFEILLCGCVCISLSVCVCVSVFLCDDGGQSYNLSIVTERHNLGALVLRTRVIPRLSDIRDHVVHLLRVTVSATVRQLESVLVVQLVNEIGPMFTLVQKSSGLLAGHRDSLGLGEVIGILLLMVLLNFIMK